MLPAAELDPAAHDLVPGKLQAAVPTWVLPPVTDLGPVGRVCFNAPAFPEEIKPEDIERLAKRLARRKREWLKGELAERRKRISPVSKDLEEAKRQLASGISGIKSRTLDDLGYRKLQGLIGYHDQIFGDEEKKYDEMLLALLDALETPIAEIRDPFDRPFDSKFQILVTIRLMFMHQPQYCTAYFPRAMSALLMARRNFRTGNHMVSGLEEIARHITRACIPPDVIDAVMDVLETEERDEAGNRTIAMGLHILTGLSARLRESRDPVDPLQERRMAKFALTCLRESATVVRRAVIEYCVELKRLITPEARFFRLVTGDIDSLMNLITYYDVNITYYEANKIG
jgi:CLIP-associating protein 1/2